MANDSYRVVTRKSWFARLANSVFGVVIGIIAILALPVLLFWNEGRAVQTAKSLAEGAGLVVSVPADAVNPANNGKLIHLSAPLDIASDLVDDLTGVTARAVSLDRVVEMYQWVESCRSETHTKVGGGEETVTKCDYSTEWRQGRVDSSNFRNPTGHQNPSPSLDSEELKIDSAGLGAFTAGRNVLNLLGDSERRDVTQAEFAAAKARLPGGKPAELVDGRIILSQRPLEPRVGDLRIGYRMVPGGEVSAVARQDGNGLAAYQTEAGDALLMVARGQETSAAMFAKAEADNRFLTWVLRAVGVGGLFLGFAFLFGPIATVADVIPPVGALVRLGTGVAALILALLLGGTVIGIAWLWYRPLLGLAILALTALAVWGLSRWGAKRVPAPVATGAVQKM